MRINVTARHFKLSEDLRNHAENEVHRLKRYYEGIIDVDIVLGWEKKDRIAEINIRVNGTVLTARERSDDMIKSINNAVDKLERQIKRYKGKVYGFEHEKIGIEPEVTEEVSQNYDEDV